jgi:hypothetical protein
MGWLNEIAGAIAERNGSGSRASRGTDDVLGSCCATLGIPIEKRETKIAAIRYGGREIHVIYGPGDELMEFGCPSRAMSLVKTAAPIALSMLLRNFEKTTGSWQATTADDGSICFSFCYTAITQGLNPAMFLYVCKKLTEEVIEFEQAVG